jgi:hypothetical protein
MVLVKRSLGLVLALFLFHNKHLPFMRVSS